MDEYCSSTVIDKKEEQVLEKVKFAGVDHSLPFKILKRRIATISTCTVSRSLIVRGILFITTGILRET